MLVHQLDQYYRFVLDFSAGRVLSHPVSFLSSTLALHPYKNTVNIAYVAYLHQLQIPHVQGAHISGANQYNSTQIGTVTDPSCPSGLIYCTRLNCAVLSLKNVLFFVFVSIQWKSVLSNVLLNILDLSFSLCRLQDKLPGPIKRCKAEWWVSIIRKILSIQWITVFFIY